MNGDRIGLAPGGIAEMFVGQDADEEYAILNSRKGFIRLAIKHGVPVVPIYCFGGSKLLCQMTLPSIFERISILLRVSICIFFGKWGLPIPFRQRLLYVVGQPIHPPSCNGNGIKHEGEDFDFQVDEMHNKLCIAITTIFNKYKEYYGWENKKLQIL